MRPVAVLGRRARWPHGPRAMRPTFDFKRVRKDARTPSESARRWLTVAKKKAAKKKGTKKKAAKKKK